MVKFVYCLRKRADVSAEEFYRRWTEMGPVIKEHAKAMKAVHYVQSHTIAPEVNAMLINERYNGKPAYDGISELWYNSIEEMMEAFASEELQKAGSIFHEGESKFIDFSESCMFMTEEHTIF